MSTRKRAVFFLLLILISSTSLAHTRADSTTLYSTDMDSSVDSESPAVNHGNDVGIGIKDADGFYNWGIFKFNLSELPSGAEITNATFRAYWRNWWGAGETGRNLATAKTTDGWTEGAVTWNNKPAKGVDTDNLDVEGAYGWREWDVTDYTIEEFDGDKNISIYLWATESRNYWDFWSSEGDYSPELYVEYTIPTPPLEDEEEPPVSGVIWPDALTGISLAMGVPWRQAGIMISLIFTIFLMVAILIGTRGKKPDLTLSISALLSTVLFTGMGWYPMWLGSVLALVVALLLAMFIQGKSGR